MLCVYDEIIMFSEGLAMVKKDDKWGFINSVGELMISCIYSSVRQLNVVFGAWHKIQQGTKYNRHKIKFITNKKSY